MQSKFKKALDHLRPQREAGKGRIGAVRSLRLLLPAVLLSGALSAGAYGKDAPAPVASKDLQAKVHYCTTCHGVSGQGFRGFYPIPRLAGQQPDYIKNQLQAFTQKRRTNPIMFSVAHVLTPEMLTELSQYFLKLDPKPLGGAPANLVADGKAIFHNGIASANIPACATCHGDKAEGNSQIPRLAGQVDEYVVAKLTNWDKERGQIKSEPDASAIMEPIAHGLTPAQIKAVAAYVSTLE
jgi:cytochrome c553